MQELMQRLQQLEDLEAIRQLKHRYLNACDRKEVEAIRACFATGEILIDYGPIGVFHDRDSFVAVYEQMACQPQVIDLHHGANPEITLQPPDQAVALWALYYFNLNADTGLTQQLGGVYHDQYKKTAEGWRITATTCRLHSIVGGENKEQQP